MELSRLTIEIFSKLEQKWLSEWDNPKLSLTAFAGNRKTRILTIDGAAGARGLISGELLIHLEDQLCSAVGDPKARIPDFFDLIAGTGIGGVLAAMITASDCSSGRPLFSAHEAVEFLCSRHRRLFRPSGYLLRRRRGPKLSAGSFEVVLREAFLHGGGRALTLKDSCRPLLIPCYDLNTSAPFVFSRADAAESASFDFDLWKVCRATTATPGLFRPYALTSVDGMTACLAVDGGLVMNNPSAAAVTHVLLNKREFPAVAGVQDLLLLSLGSSFFPAPAPSWWHRRLKTGFSGLATVDIVLDGMSETVDHLLSNAFSWNRCDYVRISVNGCHMAKETMDGGVELDGLTRAGARMLKEKSVESFPFVGKRLLTETNGERIGAFARRLVAIGCPEVMTPSPSKGSVAVNELADGR
ncbi:Patatin group A-3 [Apostasia shenzhenica]|uniref:Patatin n=1 Tax=Apostasia shenzhenica TaxID=1088818 RepID=A0A2I0B480_9ASPA|nr:Patatin group A-3 [Apostasia shenzhenica]